MKSLWTIVVIMSVVVLCAESPGTGALVDPQLVDQAAKGAPLRTIIVLRSQPHDRIVRPTRTIHQYSIDAALAEVTASASANVINEQRIAIAHAAADAAELRVRRLVGE